MKRLCIAVLLLLTIALSLPAEGFLGAGTFFTLSSVSQPPLTPALYFTGGYDVFKPAGPRWSIFSNGGGKVFLYPGSLDFGGSSYLAGDVSYRGEILFSRLELGMYLEHRSWQTGALLDNYGELYLSLDFKNISIFTSPAFVWEIEDRQHTVGMEGAFGLSAGIGSLVFSPAVNGGIRWIPAGGLETSYGSSIDLTWYPGIPLTTAAVIGFLRTDSAYTETVISGADPLPVDSGWTIYWEPEIAFFISSRFDLSLVLDGSFTFKDYNFINSDGTFGSGREYRLYGEPELILTFAATPSLDIQFQIGTEFLYSNSSYLNMVSGTADLSASIWF
jgi:hypothetical protein